MSSTCCETMWLLFLLKDFGLCHFGAVDLFCDSQSAFSMCKNPIFHDHTKHIKVDWHFIRKKVLAGIVKPSYIQTNFQLVDLFTKALLREQFQFLQSKMSILNIHRVLSKKNEKDIHVRSMQEKHLFNNLSKRWLVN